MIFFFLSGFSSQTLTIHSTAGKGRGPYFVLLYHFHPLMNMETFICNFAYFSPKNSAHRILILKKKRRRACKFVRGSAKPKMFFVFDLILHDLLRVNETCFFLSTFHTNFMLMSGLPFYKTFSSAYLWS